MSSRVRSRDMFMLIALWMEYFPSKSDPSPPRAFPNCGAILVSPQDHIIALDHSQESHAIVRVITRYPVEANGADLYVSRYPCSLCVKIMVQAGIRKCYYFPAKDWELYSIANESKIFSPNGKHSLKQSLELPHDVINSTHSSPKSLPPLSYSPNYYYSPNHGNGTNESKKERNLKSVSRLVANNNLALLLYIPKWDTASDSPVSVDNHTVISDEHTKLWMIDPQIAHYPGISKNFDSITKNFETTKKWVWDTAQKYKAPLIFVNSGTASGDNLSEVEMVWDMEGDFKNGTSSTSSANDLYEEIKRHAMVLAHIAAKRTDDNKIGVGAVLYSEGKYLSVGWNGFPKKAQDLDYPQSGADDLVDEDELKYDYILHAEQNTLLWRPTSRIPPNSLLISTKMPCDECSPIIHDCGIVDIVTNKQVPKRMDDPARLRGLTYENVGRLMRSIAVFDI